MLPKNQRLKTSSEFSATYRQKRSVANSLLILYAGGSKKKPELFTRVGFVVSKKIHKRAVKRNRAKRLIREAYRNALKEGKINSSQKYISLIFLARDAAVGAGYNDIYNALLNCINKASKKF